MHEPWSSMVTQGRNSTDGHFGPRIVVIDDDLGVRRALVRLLRSAGYTVRTFASSEEFLASCRPDEVDCLIVDVYLGGMSGFDLYDFLASAGAVPPIIFVTAHEDAILAAGAFASTSSVACLRKPFEDDALLSALAVALQRARK
jgi:FixJ family two-component response regulator